MEPDYDEITIEVDTSEWDDAVSKCPTQTDLSPDSWMLRLLRTDDRVFRVNVCIADAEDRTVAHTQKTLLGVGFSLLKLDAVDGRVHCFLMSIVRTPESLQACLKGLKGLLADTMPSNDLSITYADVTFLSEGWSTYS